MERNLLLGNGINVHLCINGLNITDIADRFADCLRESNDFFDLMFGVRFIPEVCKEIYSKTEKRGIESLVAIMYNYLTSNTMQGAKTFLFKNSTKFCRKPMNNVGIAML